MICRFLMFNWTVALALMLAQPVLAQDRVALVIGNSEYTMTARLPNARNDSEDMALKLSELGFTVTLEQDLSLAEMTHAVQRFARQAASSQEALVFFAGHGMEVEGENWLIPVDARLEADIDVEFEAVPMSVLLSAVSRARGLKLVILDACRDNPFIVSMDRRDRSRSVGRGLARVDPTEGTLVAFAARAGQVAADGDGRNSPYTSALLSVLDTPGLELGLMFRKVRDKVMETTGRRQEPFTYGSLSAASIYLNPPRDEEEAPPAAYELARSAPAPVAPPSEQSGICDAYFTQVREIGACYAYEAFVEDCSDHPFRNIAQRFIERECSASQDMAAVSPMPEPVQERSVPVIDHTASPALPPSGHGIPSGWCAVTIASRPNLQEAVDFVALLPRGQLHDVEIYPSSNGWFAISSRRVPQAQANAALAQGKAAGLYPDDAYCTTGARFGAPAAWRNMRRTITVRVAYDTTGSGYMNLRAGPGTNYAALARMTNGTRVAVLETSGAWGRVRRSDGLTGWMHMAARYGFTAED
jgi:hypothetical protein